MKFAAAALLAIAATAVQIKKQEDGDLPFPEPVCPEKPTESEIYDASLEDAFAAIDADGSGEVDAQEGFNALWCMAKWEVIDQEEAKWLGYYLGAAAGEDELLSMEEAQAALDTLESGCTAPTETASPEDVFNTIDTDGSGDIDALEGVHALGCAVEWGLISTDDAIEAFEYLGSHAGDDGLLNLEEASAAIAALSEYDELAQEGCGIPKPSKEEMENATPEDVFKAIDANKSGDIDADEAKAALVCAVEWEVISKDEAKEAEKSFTDVAGDDNLLTMAEAKAAVEAAQ
jgi:Ca2+-binding EF-hand superfamily protein